MNCTKVTPASPIFVDFYYYYSFFMLILTSLISPLQFYLILTKSKSLKNFKWLILNQSFWCLLLELCFTIVKPFFLPPAVAGFPLGFLRFGNRITSILGFCAFSLVLLMQCAALVITIINRYLFVFPSKLINLIDKKLIIFGFLLYSGISSSAYLYIIYPYLFVDTDASQKSAVLEYDPCLKIYFNEPAFIFFTITKTALFYCLLVFLFACGAFFVIIFLLAFFIYRVYFHEAASIVKLQKSLITSVIVQVFISLIFLCFPVFCYVFIISFQISHLWISNLTQLACCAISSHSFLESLATMYFVAPYRKAIKAYLEHHFSSIFKKVLPNVVQISRTSTTSSSIAVT